MFFLFVHTWISMLSPLRSLLIIYFDNTAVFFWSSYERLGTLLIVLQSSLRLPCEAIAGLSSAGYTLVYNDLIGLF